MEPACVLTYGAGNRFFFAESSDAGKSWSKPVVVSAQETRVGMRRGPRIAMTPEAIVISAVAEEGPQYRRLCRLALRERRKDLVAGRQSTVAASRTARSEDPHHAGGFALLQNPCRFNGLV